MSAVCIAKQRRQRRKCRRPRSYGRKPGEGHTSTLSRATIRTRKSRRSRHTETLYSLQRIRRHGKDLALSSESCEELMKQSNQGQARAEQNRQRDAELSRQLISELKKNVEQLENSNELLQNAISAEIGSLRDEVRESTVQEVKKALQANLEAIQRVTEALEKESETLTAVMKQKVRELEESKERFFQFEGTKEYLFWAGMTCSIGTCAILIFNAITSFLGSL